MRLEKIGRGPVSQGMEFGFLILGAVRIHVDFKQGWCDLM